MNDIERVRECKKEEARVKYGRNVRKVILIPRVSRNLFHESEKFRWVGFGWNHKADGIFPR